MDGSLHSSPLALQSPLPVAGGPVAEGIRVRALYEYAAVEPGELSFNPGDLIIQA